MLLAGLSWATPAVMSLFQEHDNWTKTWPSKPHKMPLQDPPIQRPGAPVLPVLPCKPSGLSWVPLWMKLTGDEAITINNSHPWFLGVWVEGGEMGAGGRVWDV